MTNTLAYCEHSSITDIKSFITFDPGVQYHKTFLYRTYECLLKAWVFHNIGPGVKYHKTFFVQNLRMFAMSLSVL